MHMAGIGTGGKRRVRGVLLGFGLAAMRGSCKQLYRRPATSFVQADEGTWFPPGVQQLENCSNRVGEVLQGIYTNEGLGPTIAGALTLGVVAAILSAALNAVVDPIASHMVSKRAGMKMAMQRASRKGINKSFWMILPTNLMKFPVFELVLALVKLIELPTWLPTWMPLITGWQGFISGLVFCTLMLPIVNASLFTAFRREPSFRNMYKAYLPTLIRDAAYGGVREASQDWLLQQPPDWCRSVMGHGVLFGLSAALACLCAAPFNEWRAWWLQRDTKPLVPFHRFVNGRRFVRTNLVQTVLTGLSLGAAKCLSVNVERMVRQMPGGRARGLGLLANIVILLMWFLWRWCYEPHGLRRGRRRNLMD